MARRSETLESLNRLLTPLLVMATIATLYFAREVLIPLALAALLSFLLAPLVDRLEKWKLGRVPAVLAAAFLSFAVIGGTGWLVVGQLVDLAGKLPQYRENIRHKVASLRGASGGGALHQATVTLQELGRDIASTTSTVESTGTTAQSVKAMPTANRTMAVSSHAQTSMTAEIPGAVSAATAVEKRSAPPVPVQVVEGPSSPLDMLRHILGPLVAPLAKAGIVIIFVIFMLLEREELRDRVIRLLGHGKLMITTQALDEAARRVSRYLLMNVIVNISYGVPIAIGLWLIGVPNALLWGLLASILRFIPYVGPWVGASMPIALSLAVFDGWSLPVLTIMLFVVVELVSNNVVEPWLYGSSTGIIPLALIAAAVFWAWLWGGVGLFMSTPLTVCLAVLGRYVPQLGFLNVLLGDEPVLSPPERIYQRLLAGDQEEATELATQQAKEMPLEQLYDIAIIPALSLAERDRHQGRLDEDQRRYIRQAARDLVDELGDNASAPAESTKGKMSEANPVDGSADDSGGQCRARVLCLPARDDADELAGIMLAQVLTIAGCAAKVVGVNALAGEMIESVEEDSADVVCISALPPMAVTHARYLCKRLRARCPNLRIVVGLWSPDGDIQKAEERLRSAGAEEVVTSVTVAVDRIQALSGVSRATCVTKPAGKKDSKASAAPAPLPARPVPKPA